MLNNEMTAEDRAALKPGDRVWVGEYSRERVDLGVVTKTSRTRFSVAPNPLNTGYIAQYRIGDGYRYDRHLGGCVHYRATPAEVQEWEALKQREAAEREERERERQAIQDTGADTNPYVECCEILKRHGSQSMRTVLPSRLQFRRWASGAVVVYLAARSA